MPLPPSGRRDDGVEVYPMGHGYVEVLDGSRVISALLCRVAVKRRPSCGEAPLVVAQLEGAGIALLAQLGDVAPALALGSAARQRSGSG